MEQFINHNGTILAADHPVFLYNNRGFCYGDAIFETIRIANYKPQFLKEHFQRLFWGISLFKMQMEEQLNQSFFEGAIIELAKKNNLNADGRAKLTIYRNQGGLYSPENNTISYLIEISTLLTDGYKLNIKGFNIDLYTEIKKSQNILSSIKSNNCAIYIMASIYKKQNLLDECILFNDKGCITEAISSNIFVVKNGVLYTPEISSGCIEGVMRKKIIDIARDNHIEVYELSMLPNVLLEAEELFLTNAISGIQWVLAYKQKKYINTTAIRLIEKLNELIY